MVVDEIGEVGGIVSRVEKGEFKEVREITGQGKCQVYGVIGALDGVVEGEDRIAEVVGGGEAVCELYDLVVVGEDALFVGIHLSVYIAADAPPFWPAGGAGDWAGPAA